jgi:two-component sensor histidine kinase
MAVAMTVLGFRQTVSFEADTPATRTDGSVAVTFDSGMFIESISVLAVIFLSTWAATHIARRFIADRLPAFQASGQALVTTGAIVVASQAVLVVVGVSFLLPWFPEPPGLEPWTPLLTVVPLMLVALTHGLIRSVSRRRAAVSSGLIAANRDLRWEIASINERLWDRRRRRATHVHGPVQAALNAAALRLRSVAGGDVDAATRDEVTRAVDLLLAERSGGTDIKDDSTVPVATRLAEIAELWRGVCALDVAVEAGVLQRVEADHACSSALIAIVGEACTNAVRHGDAQHVRLHVEILDDRVARVTVTDDGAASSPGSSPGLGSRLLDEVTLDWSLGSEAGGTALVADLPLAPVSR